MPVLDKFAIANAIYHAGGGDSSQIQEPKQVYLGHPAFPNLDPRLSPDAREYAGQVWVHEGSGAFGSPDDASTSRDDMQPAVFTVFLPAGAIPEGHIRYDLAVLVRNISGRLTVVGEAGIEAREFVEGVPEHTTSAIGPDLFAFGLLRPTNPPSTAVELVGGIYMVDDTIYAPPTKVTGDLITTYTAGLVGNQAKVVQVRFDPAAQTFDYTAGSAFNDSWFDAATGINDHVGAFANYPATNASTTLFNRGWIKFRNSMTDIKATDILPDPGFLTVGGGGGLAEEDLPSVAFANKFTAKFTTGLISALPGTAAGIGDAYFATDTQVLYICISGTAWTGFDIGDGNVSNKAYLLLTGGTMAGNIAMGQNEIDFHELSGDPSAPATTHWLLYAYNNAVFLKDDNGTTYDLTATSGGSGTGISDYCRVHSGSDTQTFANASTEYQIESFTEGFDEGGYFNSGTDANRFVIPSSKGGRFRIGFNVRVSDTGEFSPELFIVYLKSGTTVLARDSIHADFPILSSPNIDYWYGGADDIVQLADSDTVGLYYQYWGSGTPTIVMDASMWLIRLGDTP